MQNTNKVRPRLSKKMLLVFAYAYHAIKYGGTIVYFHHTISTRNGDRASFPYTTQEHSHLHLYTRKRTTSCNDQIEKLRRFIIVFYASQLLFMNLSVQFLWEMKILKCKAKIQTVRAGRCRYPSNMTIK